MSMSFEGGTRQEVLNVNAEALARRVEGLQRESAEVLERMEQVGREHGLSSLDIRLMVATRHRLERQDQLLWSVLRETRLVLAGLALISSFGGAAYFAHKGGGETRPDQSVESTRNESPSSPESQPYVYDATVSEIVDGLMASKSDKSIPWSREELHTMVGKHTLTNKLLAQALKEDSREFYLHLSRRLADRMRDLALSGHVSEALRWRASAPEYVTQLDLLALGHRPEAGVDHLLKLVESPKVTSDDQLVGMLTDELEGNEEFIGELNFVMQRRARLNGYDQPRMERLRTLLGQALHLREEDIADEYRRLSDHPHQSDRADQVSNHRKELERVHRAEEKLGFKPVQPILDPRIKTV